MPACQVACGLRVEVQSRKKGIAGQFRQICHEPPLGRPVEFVHRQSQAVGDALEQRPADGAPTCLDQVQVGRRDAHGQREAGLRHAGGLALLADSRSEQRSRHAPSSQPRCCCIARTTIHQIIWRSFQLLTAFLNGVN